ncbi:uncharacterized protein EI90DRAFT_3044590 [Cantharellus anzutake]|uniref:uncharacterized protein n=1 Tax=Cantharellus anzutake TaxID=1750568 RepID=UPI0019063C71|nr:uncharacterized protein EI90DRAFT_3044590 [Cantharellus anzutake]KAF8337023.1 hypothetical protein EI90DRAFT_3044590 [Cantharellus anzutake]
MDRQDAKRALCQWLSRSRVTLTHIGPLSNTASRLTPTEESDHLHRSHTIPENGEVSLGMEYGATSEAGARVRHLDTRGGSQSYIVGCQANAVALYGGCCSVKEHWHFWIELIQIVGVETYTAAGTSNEQQKTPHAEKEETGDRAG